MDKIREEDSSFTALSYFLNLVNPVNPVYFFYVEKRINGGGNRCATTGRR